MTSIDLELLETILYRENAVIDSDDVELLMVVIRAEAAHAAQEV